MNREIKFKSYFKGYKDGKIYSSLWGFIDHKGNHSKDSFMSPSSMSHADRIADCQFTGLTDKNGVEVYQGDICIIHIFTQELAENLGVIEGEKEFIGKINFDKYGVRINEEPLFAYCGFHEESLEVIGNIFETPELLEER